MTNTVVSEITGDYHTKYSIDVIVESSEVDMKISHLIKQFDSDMRELVERERNKYAEKRQS